MSAASATWDGMASREPREEKAVPRTLRADLARLRSLMGHRYDEIRDSLPELLERYGDLRDPRAVKGLLARFRMTRGGDASDTEPTTRPADMDDEAWELQVAGRRGEPTLN